MTTIHYVILVITLILLFYLRYKGNERRAFVRFVGTSWKQLHASFKENFHPGLPNKMSLKDCLNIVNRFRGEPGGGQHPFVSFCILRLDYKIEQEEIDKVVAYPKLKVMIGLIGTIAALAPELHIRILCEAVLTKPITEQQAYDLLMTISKTTSNPTIRWIANMEILYPKNITV